MGMLNDIVVPPPVRIAPKWNWKTCCLRKAFCPTSAAPIEAGDLMDRPNQILRCELACILLCYFLADEVVVLFHVGQSAHFSPPQHVDSKILEDS